MPVITQHSRHGEEARDYLLVAFHSSYLTTCRAILAAIQRGWQADRGDGVLPGGLRAEEITEMLRSVDRPSRSRWESLRRDTGVVRLAPGGTQRAGTSAH